MSNARLDRDVLHIDLCITCSSLESARARVRACACTAAPATRKKERTKARGLGKKKKKGNSKNRENAAMVSAITRESDLLWGGCN